MMQTKVASSLARMRERSPDARAQVAFQARQVVIDVIDQAWQLQGYVSRSDYARDVVCRAAFEALGLPYPKDLSTWGEDRTIANAFSAEEQRIATKLLGLIDNSVKRSISGTYAVQGEQRATRKRGG